MALSSSQFMPNIEKLDCIVGIEKDVDKLIKAKSKLILLIKPINFAHIQSCNTAKEIWDKLRLTFEDSGLTRRVALIRTMNSSKLENFANIEECM